MGILDDLFDDLGLNDPTPEPTPEPKLEADLTQNLTLVVEDEPQPELVAVTEEREALPLALEAVEEVKQRLDEAERQFPIAVVEEAMQRLNKAAREFNEQPTPEPVEVSVIPTVPEPEPTPEPEQMYEPLEPRKVQMAKAKAKRQQLEQQFSTAGENTQVDLIDVRSRLETIIKEMSKTHKERSDAIRTAWIAALARQHFLMLGPGGTGKSMLARDMATRVTGARYFEAILNPHSEPDHIAGPANLKRVAEEGIVSRVIAGKLPEAHFAFLDEFFNASDSLLHYLQPVLNERVSDHMGDGTPTAIPLRFMLMGTNRIPEELELAPLFDRVHHRVKVGYVQRRNARAAVVNDGLSRRREGASGPHTTVTLQELDAAHRAANLLNLSTRAREVMLDIVETLERDGVTISTRRMVEFAGASAANAWLNGHDEIQVGDLVVGVDMLWSQDAQIKQVQKVVREMTQVVSDSSYLKEMAESLRSVWKEFQGVEPDVANRKDDVIALYRRVEDIEKRVTAGDLGSAAVQEVSNACIASRAAMTRAAFGVLPVDIDGNVAADLANKAKQIVENLSV